MELVVRRHEKKEYVFQDVVGVHTAGNLCDAPASACTDLQTAKTQSEGYFSHGGGAQKQPL
jgi:hypothetical protein